MKFKVGDEVRLLVNAPEGNRDLKAGDFGVVCRISSTGSIGVSFATLRGSGYGHNLHGEIADDSGWYVSPDKIELVCSNQDKIELSAHDLDTILNA